MADNTIIRDVPFDVLIILGFIVGRAFRAVHDGFLGIEYHAHGNMLFRIEAGFPRRSKVDIFVRS
jgi:hypothetical protein